MFFRHLSKVLHPFLFAVFPFVFFLAQNPAELHVADIIFPFFLTMAATAIVFVWVSIFLKNTVKAAIVTSLCLLFFFSYGYVYDGLSGVSFASMEIGRARYLLPAYGVIFLTLIVHTIFTRSPLKIKILGQFLNMVAFVLVASSAAIVVLRFFNDDHYASITTPPSSVAENMSGQGTAVVKPDIYYIILDAYGNEHTLAELYDYDNSPFLSRLKDKGFYVANKSASNFAETSLSIASSLNFEYVNYLTDVVAGREKDFDPTVELIQNSKAWQFLQNQGYAFVTFRSIWGETGYNPYADVNLRGGKFNELSILIINTTLLRASLLYPPIRSYFFGDFRERILYTFAQLGAMPEFERITGPKFIFVHIVSPHPPFIFGPNGEETHGTGLSPKPEDVVWNADDKQYYVDQITFLNKKLEAMVDEIISKSTVPPIIVLQGDHGPWSTVGEDRTSNRFYRERMRIFNAYYLPDDGRNNLYESITPVNTFRLIFNTYFGADFRLLEDKNYFSNSVRSAFYPKTPYQFIDVTDVVADWDE